MKRRAKALLEADPLTIGGEQYSCAWGETVDMGGGNAVHPLNFNSKADGRFVGGIGLIANAVDPVGTRAATVSIAKHDVMPGKVRTITFQRNIPLYRRLLEPATVFGGMLVNSLTGDNFKPVMEGWRDSLDYMAVRMRLLERIARERLWTDAGIFHNKDMGKAAMRWVEVRGISVRVTEEDVEETVFHGTPELASMILSHEARIMTRADIWGPSPHPKGSPDYYLDVLGVKREGLGADDKLVLGAAGCVKEDLQCLYKIENMDVEIDGRVRYGWPFKDLLKYESTKAAECGGEVRRGVGLPAATGTGSVH